MSKKAITVTKDKKYKIHLAKRFLKRRFYIIVTHRYCFRKYELTYQRTLKRYKKILGSRFKIDVHGVRCMKTIETDYVKRLNRKMVKFIYWSRVEISRQSLYTYFV